MSEQAETILKIFEDFLANHNPSEYEIFSTEYIFSHELWRWNKKIGVSKHLAGLGINPDCVLKSVKGRYKKNHKFLKQTMDELADLLGKDGLNDNSMNTREEIVPPKPLRTEGKFHRTDEVNFPLKKIKISTIQRNLCRTSGLSWAEILKITGYEDSQKKIAKNELKTVVENTNNYIKKNRFKSYYEINQEKIRKAAPEVWKQIYKVPGFLDFKVEKHSKFFLGIFCLDFFSEEKKLPTQKEINSIETYKKFKNFLSFQDSIRWDRNERVLKDVVLGMYARGSFIYADEEKSSLEQRAFNYIRHLKGKESKDVYRKIGISINELQKLKLILESGYSRSDIHKKFRELVLKNIETGINHLKR